MSIWVILKSLKKNCQTEEEKFYSSLVGKNITINGMIMLLRFGRNLKWKIWKIIMICT